VGDYCYDEMDGFVAEVSTGHYRDMNLFMVVFQDDDGELWGFDYGFSPTSGLGYYDWYGEPEGGVEVYPVEAIPILVTSYRRVEAGNG
jgi:hypothetical protein